MHTRSDERETRCCRKSFNTTFLNKLQIVLFKVLPLEWTSAFDPAIHGSTWQTPPVWSSLASLSLRLWFLLKIKNEFLLSQSSAWEKAKSHTVLDLGNTEGGQELRFVFLTKSCLTLTALCAGAFVMVEEPWLVTPQCPPGASNSVMEAKENLLVEVLIYSFTLRHKFVMNQTLPVIKCNQHDFGLRFLHAHLLGSG